MLEENGLTVDRNFLLPVTSSYVQSTEIFLFYISWNFYALISLFFETYPICLCPIFVIFNL